MHMIFVLKGKKLQTVTTAEDKHLKRICKKSKLFEREKQNKEYGSIFISRVITSLKFFFVLY